MEQNIEISTILLGYVLEDSEEEELPQKIRSVWMKNWVARRLQEGFDSKLLEELRTEEPDLYRNFLRMDSKQFNDLLSLVTPHIQKQDTNMRTSISAGANKKEYVVTYT